MIHSLSVFDWSFTFTLLQKSLPVAAAPPSISTAVFCFAIVPKKAVAIHTDQRTAQVSSSKYVGN
ncbi:MAG: hypothetical protein WA231_14910 [Methylocella sp.]